MVYDTVGRTDISLESNIHKNEYILLSHIRKRRILWLALLGITLLILRHCLVQTLFTILTVFVIKIRAHAAVKVLCIVQVIQETLIYKHWVKEKEVIDLQKLTKVVLLK